VGRQGRDSLMFCVGTKVVKPKGYPFPGEVRSVFTNRAGETRYVVESESAPGMLHIFAPTQIERFERPEPTEWR